MGRTAYSNRKNKAHPGLKYMSSRDLLTLRRECTGLKEDYNFVKSIDQELKRRSRTIPNNK